MHLATNQTKLTTKPWRNARRWQTGRDSARIRLKKSRRFGTASWTRRQKKRRSQRNSTRRRKPMSQTSLKPTLSAWSNVRTTSVRSWPKCRTDVEITSKPPRVALLSSNPSPTKISPRPPKRQKNSAPKMTATANRKKRTSTARINTGKSLISIIWMSYWQSRKKTTKRNLSA